MGAQPLLAHLSTPAQVLTPPQEAPCTLAGRSCEKPVWGECLPPWDLHPPVDLASTLWLKQNKLNLPFTIWKTLTPIPPSWPWSNTAPL